MIPLPHKKYKTIVADPPWQPIMAIINSPTSKIGAPKASPQRHYHTMSVEEIEKLIPPSEDKSHLWLWVLSQHIDWGYRVARAWGFEPIQTITWCKNGLGVGRFQCNTEHILVCRKGDRKDNPFGRTEGTYFKWDRGKHSEKPNEFYNLVEKVSLPPYLDMFARKSRLNWDVWGNEAPNHTQAVLSDSRLIAINRDSAESQNLKSTKILNFG